MIETKVYGMDVWAETLAAMGSGVAIEVSEEVFDYFLDVLPPVFMNRNFKFGDGQVVKATFGFAEGSELIKVFWMEAGRLFCRQSTMMNRSEGGWA